MRRISLKRINRRWRVIQILLRTRAAAAGYTLMEVVMAMMVASTFTVMVLSFIAEGLGMLVESEKLQAAAAAAQLRMAILRTDPDPEPSEKEGAIGGGVFQGMQYKLQVSNSEIDLAKVQASGDLATPALDDAAPAGPQNSAGAAESQGVSERSVTGGIIPVKKIRLEISYPIGSETGKLIIHTMQPRRPEAANES
ncbi:MAG: hypothetical protein K1X75_04995 [Leptospirales bacterium]|nr:hypothetical protein [Leptospirales bacterium]